jgi:hypothetical protein
MNNQPPFYLPLPATLFIEYSCKLLDLERVLCYYYYIVNKPTKGIKMNHMTDDERKDYVIELKDLQLTIVEAVNRIADIIHEVGDKHTEAYLLATLQIAADCDHGYYTNDDNLSKFIQRLEEGGDDDPDDDGMAEDEPGTFITHDDGHTTYRYADNTEVDLPDEYEPPSFEGGEYVQVEDGRWQYHWPDGSVWSFATGFNPPA